MTGTEPFDAGGTRGAVAQKPRSRFSLWDASVAALALACCLTPLLAAQSAGRMGPVVAAERQLLISGSDTHTVWRSAALAVAERGAPPAWARARLLDSAPLGAELALATPAPTVEIDPAPIWSPYIAARSVEDPATDLAEDYVQLASLDAGVYTGYATSAPRIAPRPVFKPRGSGFQVLPRISIVLTAVGINEAASRDALRDLPSEIAFAIAPVGAAPGDWAASSRRDGRVTLLELPMEPLNFPRVNPGPLTLLAKAEPDDNLARLDDALAKLGRVDGVSTYLGGRFKTDAGALRPVLRALRERNLFVFENGAARGSRLSQVAERLGVEAAPVPMQLDNGGRAKDISDALARLERRAARDGSAVGVAVAVPATVAALADWADALEQRGYRLTPLRP